MQTKILLKARDLMLQSGLRQVTMDDLAHQLGISKKTIYLYYKDKDDLVKAVVNLELKEHEMTCKDCKSKAENSKSASFSSQMRPVIQHSLFINFQKFK